ncbi:MAG: hypothetical protein HYZ90_06145, partial [Candidatus Omnitrophica bacterium]|nr:hypothetical protein [Candidatus Omnitrophota bacterium]
MAEERMELAFLCGNKYNFRAMGEACLRQWQDRFRSRVFLHDFPRDYDALPLLARLKAQGLLREFAFIPDIGQVGSHYRALRSLRCSLLQEPMDLLIVDDDSAPMAQCLIDIARRKGAPVFSLEIPVPIWLVTFYQKKKEHSGSPGSSGSPPRRERITLREKVRRDGLRGLLLTLYRNLRSRTLSGLRDWMHYWLLSLLFLGKRFPRHPLERRGILQLATDRVDGAIVYSSLVQEALQHFFPKLRIAVAQHPLSGSCRCAPARGGASFSAGPCAPARGGASKKLL